MVNEVDGTGKTVLLHDNIVTLSHTEKRMKLTSWIKKKILINAVAGTGKTLITQ